MDNISILIKSILDTPSEAEIAKFQKKLEETMGKVKIKEGKFQVLNSEDIDIYIKKLQNSLSRTNFKTPKVFDSDEVKKEINKLNIEFEKLRTGETNMKRVGMQFDNVKTKITQVQSGLKNVNKDGYSFLQMIELAGKKIAVWGISTTLVYGLWRQIKEGISYITELDNSLNQIRIVSGKTTEEVNKLAQAYNGLAREMSVSTNDVASTAVDLYRQGLEGIDVEERMEAIIKYAKISSISLAESNKIITATMNATGESAQKVIDIFSYLGDATASGADEIGTAMQKVASMNDGIGVSMAKAASWIAVISSKTREGASQLGTSLKSIESRYSSIKSRGFNDEDATNINDVTKALKAAGIEATTADGQLKNFAEVIDLLGAKYETLDEKTKNYVMTTLGGTYQMNRLRALMEGYTQSVDLYNKSLTQTGIANEKFNIYQESTAAKLDALKASLEGFWQSAIDSNLIKGTLDVANSLMTTLGNIPTVITTIVTAIALWKGTKLTDWLRTTGITTGAFRTTLITTRGAVLGMTEAQIAAATATKGWALSWNALKVAFMSNPIGFITTAILTAVTAIDIFNAKQEEAQRNAEEAQRKLKEEADSLLDLKSQYEDIISSGKLTNESKERLISIQDQLIKSFEIEAEGLNLVNGKYEEQIALLNDAIIKKKEESNIAIAGTYQKSLDTLSKTDTKGSSIRGTWTKTEVTDNRLDLALRESGFNYSSYSSTWNTANKTLQQRVEIYKNAIDTIRNFTNLTDQEKKALSLLEIEYNDFNETFIKHDSIVQQYVDDQKLIDFYNRFKREVNEVNTLLNTQNKTDVQNDRIKDLRDYIEDIAEQEGTLTHFKDLINDLFHTTSSSTKDGSFNFDTYTKSVQNSKKAVEDFESSAKSLSSVWKTLNDGEKVSAETIQSLVEKFPDYTQEILKINTSKEHGIILTEKLWKIERDRLVETKRAEKELLDARLANLQTLISTITVSNAIGNGVELSQFQGMLKEQAEIQKAVADAQALIDAYSNWKPSDFSGGSGGTKYKPSSKQEALKTLLEADKISLQSYYDELLKLEQESYRGYSQKSVSTIESELLSTSEKIAKKAEEYLALKVEQSSISEQIQKALLDKISLSFKSFDDSLSPTNEKLALLEHNFKLLSDDDVDKKIENINERLKLKNQLLDETNKKIVEYTSLLQKATTEEQKNLYKDQIDKLTQSSYSLAEAIYADNKSILDMQTNAIEDAISRMTAIRKVYLQDQLDTEEKRHKKVIENLDDELDEYEKFIKAKIDALDELYDKEEYNRKLQKYNKEASKIQAQINAIALDDSDEAKARRAALQEELTKITTDKSDTVRDHTRKSEKDMYEDLLKLKREHVEDLKDSEDDYYYRTKETIEKQLDDFEIRCQVEKDLATQTTTDIVVQYENMAKRIGGIYDTLIEKVKFFNSIAAAKPIVNETGGSGVGFQIVRHEYGMSDSDYYSLLANGQRWAELNKSGYNNNNSAEARQLHAENERLRKKYGVPSGVYPKYKEGGAVTHTGWAFVDGSKQNPEYFLKSLDFKMLRETVDLAKSFMPKIDVPSFQNIKNSNPVVIEKVETYVYASQGMDEGKLASLVEKQVWNNFSKRLAQKGV